MNFAASITKRSCVPSQIMAASSRALTRKPRRRPSTRRELHLDRDVVARRRRCRVPHLDARAHRLLARPVEVRIQRLDAGPLDQSDQVAGREHARHRLELARLGEECRHHLRRRHAIRKRVRRPARSVSRMRRPQHGRGAQQQTPRPACRTRARAPARCRSRRRRPCRARSRAMPRPAQATPSVTSACRVSAGRARRPARGRRAPP